MSIGCFTLMAFLEHTGAIPHFNVVSTFNLPWNNQLKLIGVMAALLVTSASLSTRAARLIESGRAQLRARNKELQKARDKAAESDRLKSEFLAAMSHELRTPLNHVIGFTELVREEAGRIELELTEVPLAGLLENSLTIVRESAARAGVTVSARLEAIPPAGWLDARRITQVLYNLLSNAVKFTPRGGAVTLSARLCYADAPGNGECLEVSVSDTGIGLRAEDLEKVFAPFERLKSDLGRRVPGTGLGLSVARKLVELHGGMIWAESAGEGQGTSVRLRLPLARPAAFRGRGIDGLAASHA